MFGEVDRNLILASAFFRAAATGMLSVLLGLLPTILTEGMVNKAQTGAGEAGVKNAEFRQGYGETLPVDDGWADVVISNGVLNLMPDKRTALSEMARVLKPEGRLQIADIVVQRAVPEDAKESIDLWTG